MNAKEEYFINEYKTYYKSVFDSIREQVGNGDIVELDPKDFELLADFANDLETTYDDLTDITDGDNDDDNN